VGGFLLVDDVLFLFLRGNNKTYYKRLEEWKMKKRNLFAAVPLTAGLLLAGCAEDDASENDEVIEEDAGMEDSGTMDNDAEEAGDEAAEDAGLTEEDGDAAGDEEEPDLDEEPSEEGAENAGADEEEPDLDEEPSEEEEE
jgi:hypothetical protein